ncbi:MAG: hypothetical protein IKU14_08465 [Rhodocyclaceae bacterium]|nr:hypothetical protein [Rhodocyclaceae bacterium]
MAMNRLSATTLHYYDLAVAERIMEKYGLDRMQALRRFIGSQTHELLEDVENGLSAFGDLGVFDIWECEIVTGDPKTSIYIRGE